MPWGPLLKVQERFLKIFMLKSFYGSISLDSVPLKSVLTKVSKRQVEMGHPQKENQIRK